MLPAMREPAESGERPPLEEVLDDVRALVEEVRNSCLWFVDAAFSPATPDEAIRALRWIERHADRDTYVRARHLRAWLSQHSSEKSANSSPAAGLKAERVT
jgi:hypothetical protein